MFDEMSVEKLGEDMVFQSISKGIQKLVIYQISVFYGDH